MRRPLSIAIVLAACLVLVAPPTARAQSIAAGLSTLLTEQTPPPAGYVRDRAAAEATFGTVADLFTIQLTSIPVASHPAGSFIISARRLARSNARAIVSAPCSPSVLFATGRSSCRSASIINLRISRRSRART